MTETKIYSVKKPILAIPDTNPYTPSNRLTALINHTHHKTAIPYASQIGKCNVDDQITISEKETHPRYNATNTMMHCMIILCQGAIIYTHCVLSPLIARLRLLISSISSTNANNHINTEPKRSHPT